MIGKHRLFRLLMAMYMALMIPLCCCFTSVWAAACCAPEQAQLQSHIERSHDHGHHDHDEKHPEGDQDNDHSVPSPEHDGSCDCGCDDSMDRTAPVKASENFNWSVIAVHSQPYQAPQAIRRFQGLDYRQGDLPPPCNSLFRQHCAHIV